MGNDPMIAAANWFKSTEQGFASEIRPDIAKRDFMVAFRKRYGVDPDDAGAIEAITSAHPPAPLRVKIPWSKLPMSMQIVGHRGQPVSGRWMEEGEVLALLKQLGVEIEP